MPRFSRANHKLDHCLACRKRRSECRRTFRVGEGIVCQECVELLHGMLEEDKARALTLDPPRS